MSFVKHNKRAIGFLLVLAIIFLAAEHLVARDRIAEIVDQSSLTNNRAMIRATALLDAGRAYLSGQNGISPDQAKGREYISRAVSELRKVSETEEGEYEIIDNRSGQKQRHRANAFITAQLELGAILCDGEGVPAEPIEGAECFRKAAEKGSPHGQVALAGLFEDGIGVPKNRELALKWYRAAAEQGNRDGQLGLGRLLLAGQDAEQNKLEAYKWFNLAAMNGNQDARARRDELEKILKPQEIARAQWFSWLFLRAGKPSEANSQASTNAFSDIEQKNQLVTATGFFVTVDGYIVTAHHVTKQAKQFFIVDDQDLYTAKLVKDDPTNDLALLKIDGRLRSWPEDGAKVRMVMPIIKKFKPLNVSASAARLGQSVATVGFPNPSLQGFKPKVTGGEISGLAGIADDPRFLQISVPVQPGNSGGPLLDGEGNVLGVICAELQAVAALATSGSLPQNVNYATKGALLKSFLNSVEGINLPLLANEKTSKDLPAIAEMAIESVAIVISSSAEPPRFTGREVEETK